MLGRGGLLRWVCHPSAVEYFHMCHETIVALTISVALRNGIRHQAGVLLLLVSLCDQLSSVLLGCL